MSDDLNYDRRKRQAKDRRILMDSMRERRTTNPTEPRRKAARDVQEHVEQLRHMRELTREVWDE